MLTFHAPTKGTVVAEGEVGRFRVKVDGRPTSAWYSRAEIEPLDAVTRLGEVAGA